MQQDILVSGDSKDYSARERLKEELRAGYSSAWKMVSEYVCQKTRANVKGHGPRIVTQADDLAQEVLLSMHRSMNTYDPTYAFGPWIQTIIANRITDELRKDMRTIRARPFEEFMSPKETYSDRKPREDRVEERDQYLESRRLKDRQRNLLRCLYVENHSIRETAHRLDVPIGTVKSRMDRALKILRDQTREHAA